MLIGRGIVDTARMGVSGWSYGGYMTVWLLGHYSRWKAGLAVAPVTDYADGCCLSDYGPSFGGAWGGSPFKAPFDQTVKAQSPITYASRIKAPVLILSDTGDPRGAGGSVVQAVSCVARLWGAGAVRRVSGGGAFPERSGACAGRVSSLRRLVLGAAQVGRTAEGLALGIPPSAPRSRVSP